jgi:hypothetical protein
MKTYEHQDSLKQPITVGQPIAFTSSYLKGVKIGVVLKLTRCRVKIKYRYTYKNKEGETCTNNWTTQIAPARTIQLGEQLAPTMTMWLLKNGN